MARSTPPSRMADIADAARRTFRDKGYKRTQVADVARAVGLSPAALYRHVESKDALFHLAFVEELPPADDLVATPEPGATVALIGARLGRAGFFPVGDRDSATSTDPEGDLRAVIAGQYRAVADHWELLALIEASVADRPDLASRYFAEGRRRGTDALARFVADGVAAGVFRSLGDPELVALQIREACAWFGWHRRNDPDTAGLDDDAAVASISEVFVQALVVR